MKKLFSHFLQTLGGLLVAIGFVACSDDEAPYDPFHFTAGGDTITIDATLNAKQTFAFACDADWQAQTDASWLVAAPSVGKAGEAQLTLMATETNVTGEDRFAHLNLTAAGMTHTIVVKQKWTNVIQLDQTSYEFDPEGGVVTFKFTTNIDGHFLLSGSVSGLSWIKPKKDANPLKAMGTYTYELTVLANETHQDRSAEFNILVVDHDDYNNVLMTSPTIVVRQKGLPVDTSSDYSADKTVTKLQTHTQGNGVPVVLMGDGFTDKDIASGHYLEVMNKAMENIFTEEPAKSLRAWFDVWAVNAVSANNAFGTQYSTCFSCHPEIQNGSIKGDENKVIEYVYAVPELASLEGLGQTLAIVVINSTNYGGVTGLAYQFGSGITEFAIAFCPIVDGLNAERFRQVITHEAIGHGLAKLYDEYAYENYGTITANAMAQVQMLQGYGWAQNVSLTATPQDVPWADFLADERYQAADHYGEVLGVYEGACTYWNGAWRPTDESMMHSNMHGFNAPSRRAIYNRVMRTGLGESWTEDYEVFVAFDQAHLPAPPAVSKLRSRAVKVCDTATERHLSLPYIANKPLVLPKR